MPSPRRAFLHLVACVSLALGAAMSEVWGLGPRQRRGLRRLEIHLDLERILTQIRILSAWFRRSKRRPRYSRRQVLLILEYAERFRLTAAEIAREFLVSQATVYRWLERRRKARLVGDTVPSKPTPPCQRICDSRRLFVADMVTAGYDKDRTISRHLHLQGEKVSPRSVGRFRENPFGPANEPEKRPRKRMKEPPETLDACAAELALPDEVSRPRLARLLQSLADAFTEGIAVDTLRRVEEGSLYGGDEYALLLSRRAQHLAILYSRMRRLAPRHRPRYTDAERAEILAVKYRFRLSNKTTAAWFLLDKGTLSDWNRDVDHPDERKRPLVAPIADLETALATIEKHLPPVPKRLRQKVAETLAALAGKLPARKGRTRKKRGREKPATPAARPRKLAPIHARYRNHYWSADLTTIELGRSFYLAAIVDPLLPRHPRLAALREKARQQEDQDPLRSGRRPLRAAQALRHRPGQGVPGRAQSGPRPPRHRPPPGRRRTARRDRHHREGLGGRGRVEVVTHEWQWRDWLWPLAAAALGATLMFLFVKFGP